MDSEVHLPAPFGVLQLVISILYMNIMLSFAPRPLLSFVSSFFLPAALFASLVLGQTASSNLNVSFPNQLSNAALGNVVQDNFLGISFELSSFDTLCQCLQHSHSCFSAD